MTTALNLPPGFQAQDFGETAKYGPGSWREEEMDKGQWVDAATDLDCLIVRQGAGAWCGYVGVPPSHPWHGKGYSACLLADCGEEWCYEHSLGARLEVHGGITYTNSCQEDAGPEAICHVPLPGREHDVWWIGFDTAHYGDVMPGYPELSGPESSYKGVGYMLAEVAQLAEQLAAVA